MIRAAVVEDMPRIRELHAETERRIGMKMDLPECSDAAILGCWVVEREGVIVSGWYDEMCIEHVEFGSDAAARAEVRGFQEEVFEAVRQKGGRYLHTLVPPALDSGLGRALFRCTVFLMSGTARKIAKHLKKSGFEPSGFMHFSRKLR